MEKVKFFTVAIQRQNEMNGLEDSINEWLSENDGVQIMDRKMCISTVSTLDQFPTANITVAIFYRNRK